MNLVDCSDELDNWPDDDELDDQDERDDDRYEAPPIYGWELL